MQCKYRHAARTQDQDRVFCRAHLARRKAAQAGLMPTSGADPNARVINRGAMAMCALTSSCNVAMEQEWGQERVISARSDGRAINVLCEPFLPRAVHPTQGKVRRPQPP